jgi:hypothetical protein
LFLFVHFCSSLYHCVPVWYSLFLARCFFSSSISPIPDKHLHSFMFAVLYSIPYTYLPFCRYSKNSQP